MAAGQSLSAILRAALGGGAAELVAGRLSSGMADVALNALIGRLFPELSPGDISQLRGIASQAFEAGRAIGRLEAGQGINPNNLPVIENLPRSSREGARFEFDIHVQFSGLDRPRLLTIYSDSDPTINDILAAMQAEGENRFAKRYPRFNRGRGSGPGILVAAAELGEIESYQITFAARRY